MHKKKILSLAFASLLPFSQIIWAEEGESVPAEQQSEAAEPVVQSNATTADSTVEAAVEAPASEVVESPATDTKMSSEATRNERYQALRKRAEEAGVMLPERPPWVAAQREMMRPNMEERMEHHQKMMSMTDEERDAYRQQRYQEMRARAEEMGKQIPDTPPWVARQQAMDDEWAKHQEVIKGMTDEERAACHAMHRRHMGMMPGQGMGQGCGMGHQGCGGMPHGGMGPWGGVPGYGYGPGPAPYGSGNFWNPNQ